MPQNPFQTSAIRRAALNLPSVRWTHRGQRIGKHQPCFHEIQMSVKLESLWVKFSFGQTRDGQGFLREVALIGNVVNGENGRCMLKESIPFVYRFKISG